MLGKTLSLKEGDSEEQHTHETLTEGCTERVATGYPEKVKRMMLKSQSECNPCPSLSP